MNSNTTARARHLVIYAKNEKDASEAFRWLIENKEMTADIADSLAEYAGYKIIRNSAKKWLLDEKKGQ